MLQDIAKDIQPSTTIVNPALFVVSQYILNLENDIQLTVNGLSTESKMFSIFSTVKFSLSVNECLKIDMDKHQSIQ